MPPASSIFERLAAAPTRSSQDKEAASKRAPQQQRRASSSGALQRPRQSPEARRPAADAPRRGAEASVSLLPETWPAGSVQGLDCERPKLVASVNPTPIPLRGGQVARTTAAATAAMAAAAAAAAGSGGGRGLKSGAGQSPTRQGRVATAAVRAASAPRAERSAHDHLPSRSVSTLGSVETDQLASESPVLLQQLTDTRERIAALEAEHRRLALASHKRQSDAASCRVDTPPKRRTDVASKGSPYADVGPYLLSPSSSLACVSQDDEASIMEQVLEGENQRLRQAVNEAKLRNRELLARQQAAEARSRQLEMESQMLTNDVVVGESSCESEKRRLQLLRTSAEVGRGLDEILARRSHLREALKDLLPNSDKENARRVALDSSIERVRH
eukprot:TRINITY_DN8049_c0_g3_i1.p1 TRINITY_DN8049_c0_g3~~TRINITY_DN8049_c0_g3_i1.p1  ORF type:complete len:388 (-),score=69.39 TRINITY_DN8049_c0_g3_i1:15-1178(-)